MKLTLQQTEKLLKGDQRFNQFVFSMMITHLRNLYAKNPSQDILEGCTKDLSEFLDRNRNTMADDYALVESIIAQ